MTTNTFCTTVDVPGTADQEEQLVMRGETSVGQAIEDYSILEDIEEAYYEVDLQGNLIAFNRAFCQMLGYTAPELIGKNNRNFQTPEMAAHVSKTFKKVFETRASGTNFVWEMVHRNGSTVIGEGSVQLVCGQGGKPVGFRGILRDITERRKMEQALRESEARFRALTNLSSDWYWEQDAEFRYVRMEGRHKKADSIQASFIGKRPWETELEIEAPGGWDMHRALLSAHLPFRDVVLHRQLPDGRPYYISVNAEPMFDSEGVFTGYRGVSREITDQKIAEERIQHLATHDSLTGLPNRIMFSNLLTAAIPPARASDQKLAVLFIDLDRFKSINDTLGHEAGDLLLKELTLRFKSSLRGSDIIARLGGDEFVVLLQGLQDTRKASTVARKILSTIVRPVMLFGRECRITASIGIAMYPDNGEDEQALMKNADIAMYYAKEEGKNNFQFFSRRIKSQSLERLMLENSLRRAAERNQFTLHYQPRRALAANAITGVEALLRWDSEELGVVPPMQFVPLAEETGLIVDIGKWVLRTACHQNMAWQRAGLPPICMAVNLSVRQFSDERLVEDIASILEETGMPPHLLELEITEGVVAHDPTHAQKVLTAIKQLGVRLAIDDFGTGYSSLGQLKNFPIDILKVDRSFVRDVANNPEDRAIVEAIVAMGKSLNLRVVAEGVENREQEVFLRNLACDEMQGFLFSRPVSADDFENLLRQPNR